jgi:hypothetical protein
MEREWSGNGAGMEREWSGNGEGMEREWRGNGEGMERGAMVSTNGRGPIINILISAGRIPADTLCL